MAGLVLYFGEQADLSAQARGAGDPVSLGKHADDLGMRVLGHHPHELFAVALGHPVARLDRLAGVDPRLEGGFQRGGVVVRCRFHGYPRSPKSDTK